MRCGVQRDDLTTAAGEEMLDYLGRFSRCWRATIPLKSSSILGKKGAGNLRSGERKIAIKTTVLMLEPCKLVTKELLGWFRDTLKDFLKF